MTENQGDRPEDQTPATESASQAPEAGAGQQASVPEQPAVSGSEPAAAQPSSPVVPDAAAPVASTGAPQTGAPAPTAPVPPMPVPPPLPATPPAGYGPVPPSGAYAGVGAAPAGAAFGAAAQTGHPTQPTMPLAGGPSAPASSAPRKKSGAGKVAALLVAAALVGGAAGLGGAYAGVQLAGSSQAQTAVPTGSGTVVVNNTDSVNEVTGIAAKVTPSVVTIEVASNRSGGTGSGVVLSSDGYVVTNTHVVTLDGASDEGRIRVTTSDGHIYDAKIVGLDPIYDLAVIKLQGASGLTPIDFGDSSNLNVGDTAVALGAPLGLENTVTTGIVSALNRSIEIASSAVPDRGNGPDSDGGDSGRGGQNGPFQFDLPGQDRQPAASETIKIAVIQTDAAINPGNSGGALVDADGSLIGINVAIASAGSSSPGGQSGSIGVGFAIPSDVVKRVANEIIDSGEATHGLLGASVQSASGLKDATVTGAAIAEVVDGGAAQKAGLQAGDIVTGFNGVPIGDSIDLTAQVRAAAAGSAATVTYVRDGSSHTVDVTLGSLS